MQHDKIIDRRVIYDGGMIFSEGDSPGAAYIIESGSVEIFRACDGDREVRLARLGAGEIFGEMALIENQNRCASARALETTVLQRITEDTLEKLRDRTPPAIWALLIVSLTRLRSTNAAMSRMAGLLPEDGRMERVETPSRIAAGSKSIVPSLAPRTVTEWPQLARISRQEAPGLETGVNTSAPPRAELPN